MGVTRRLHLPGKLRLLIGDEVLSELAFDGTEDRLDFVLGVDSAMSALCEISIKALDASTGAPIPETSGFTIATTSPSPNGQPLVKTNTEGEASLRGIAPGSYWLIVRAPGYIPRIDPIQLVAGHGTYYWEVLLHRASLIAGRILDEQGEPIRIIPRVSKPDNPLAPIGIYPDVPYDGGWFAVEGLPRGPLLFTIPGEEWAINPIRILVDSFFDEDLNIRARRGFAVDFSVPADAALLDATWKMFELVAGDPQLLWSGSFFIGKETQVRLLAGNYVLTREGEVTSFQFFTVADRDQRLEIETPAQ